MRGIAILKFTLLAFPGRALAHASEQGLVLLLPTDLYTGAGVAAVALTVVALALLPGGLIAGLFRPVPLLALSLRKIQPVTSMLAALFLALLVWAGLDGPSDPLANPLVLMVWTVFWIGFVTVQALIFDLWSYLNPWTGPLRLIRRCFAPWRYASLSPALGYWLGTLSFLAFAYLLLADPAPADPPRLARLVAAYWVFTMGLTVIFGPRWLRRAEGFTVIFRAYSRLAILGCNAGRLCLGLPGWQIVRRRPLPLSLAALCVILLGTGSFDGLNETFWWLARLGINPLEFPGRSAVVGANTLGMIAANVALLGVVAATIGLGLRVAGSRTPLGEGFGHFAPSLLPIALGYHVAHYLTSFLVDSQYALVALSDPFLTGADWLGLGEFYVSTGFFGTRSSVRAIYLAQAGAVVIGHIVAVLVAHATALRLFPGHRRAALSQAPLAVFMIGYTFFGLWLLASPRF
ncbi:MAG: hypothetical protein GY717_01530 [Rhodobacteraceae bacterium]|nr:hypothetical protein [Paracoccaceae bacterium]